LKSASNILLVENTVKSRPVWFGIVLIVIGTAMLLDHLQILALSWWLVFWACVAVASAVVLVRNSMSKKGGILWPMILFFFALYKTLWHLGALDLQDVLWFPIILIVAGLGFAVLVAIQPARWHLAIPALVLIGVGSAIILSEYGVLSAWDVRYAVRNYWPVALVLFGAAILLNRGTWKKTG
jgi:hypothetical protein